MNTFNKLKQKEFMTYAQF